MGRFQNLDWVGLQIVLQSLDSCMTFQEEPSTTLGLLPRVAKMDVKVSLAENSVVGCCDWIRSSI